MKLDEDILSFDELTVKEGGRGRASTAAACTFDVNLRMVASPIPVPPLRAPDLGQVKFFFLRCREGGREGYWLKLGHFTSREEAEKWVKNLRGVYPAAFLSEHPEDGSGQGDVPAAEKPWLA